MTDYQPEKLESLAHECSKASDAYADYVAQEKIFQVLHSGKLAALIMEQKEENPEESNVSLEMRAKASLSWKVFVGEQIRLLRESGKRRLKYEDANRKWETERSLLAIKRERFRTGT